MKTNTGQKVMWLFIFGILIMGLLYDFGFVKWGTNLSLTDVLICIAILEIMDIKEMMK